MSDTYALITVSAGSADLTAAGWAVQLNAKGATVEPDRLAGDSSRTSCVPSHGAHSCPAGTPNAAHRLARLGSCRPVGRTNAHAQRRMGPAFCASRLRGPGVERVGVAESVMARVASSWR